MPLKLPPVRSPVPWSDVPPAAASSRLRQTLQRQGFLFGSGTQALAAAILAAGQHRPGATEVIVPAYACPDLLSACLFAGARPRLVDVGADLEWGYSPQQLRASVGPSTLAIVHMNLLGLQEDEQDLAALARSLPCPLILDSAQDYSERTLAASAAEFVVLSFGRGKPLNLTGGGALFAQPDFAPGLAPVQLQQHGQVAAAVAPRRLMGLAFNIATHSRVFWLTSLLPGLKLGATTFKRLERLDLWPEHSWGRVGAVTQAHVRRANTAAMWNEVIAGWRSKGIVPLTARGSRPRSERPLRLAMLACDQAQRDRLVAEFDRHGLGASKMYELALNRTAGIPAEIAQQGPFPNAEALAARLFTLPTHGGVTEATVRSADDCVRRCC